MKLVLKLLALAFLTSCSGKTESKSINSDIEESKSVNPISFDTINMSFPVRIQNEIGTVDIVGTREFKNGELEDSDFVISLNDMTNFSIIKEIDKSAIIDSNKAVLLKDSLNGDFLKSAVIRTIEFDFVRSNTLYFTAVLENRIEAKEIIGRFNLFYQTKKKGLVYGWITDEIYETSNLDSKAKTIAKSKNSWPNNNLQRTFKIDSSDFMISASKTYWNIRLERTESFENQIKKIKTAFNIISKETNLNELNQIGILPVNDELLLDIASVSVIQKELVNKSNGGIVNSMRIVSQNAHKSKKLKQITDLFLRYNLKPYNYYIDKCRPKKTDQDTTKYSMHCATIYFKLRTLNQE